MTTSSNERSSFVRRVADVLDAAGVEYAFLHNLDGIEQRDSDVDLVVSRESLQTVDTVMRYGTLGPLVQRLDYDVPWCRYYVVQTDDPDRRYRQLDVACDPFGIGLYGTALTVDGVRRRSDEQLPTLPPGDAITYLAASAPGKGCVGPRTSPNSGRSSATILEAQTALSGARSGRRVGASPMRWRMTMTLQRRSWRSAASLREGDDGRHSCFDVCDSKCRATRDDSRARPV